MADAIGLALSVIEIANYIRDTYDEVKAFKERSMRLSDRINSLLPALELLQDSVIAEDIRALEEQEEVKIKVFHSALVQLEQCVRSAKDFIDSLKKKDWLHRAIKKESINGQFDSFSERLDILQGTIQFGIMVEMRNVIMSQEQALEKWKTNKDQFKNQTEKAYYNRQEVDLKDEQEDEKRLLGLLQDIKDDQKDQKITSKQILDKISELQIDLKQAPGNPQGFSIDQVTEITTNELKQMKPFSEGSFGVVYKAKYKMEDVAVKKIQPDKKANLTELNEQLEKEAKNMKTFDSKHVVRLWGIVKEDMDSPMIVFEYMSQGTLREYLDHIKGNVAQFPWKQRISMALGGALGIYRIHNMAPPMLHCAIGSDKFLVNSNLEVKICDVGFAKTRQSAGKSNYKKKNLSTKYYAPEHLMDNKQKLNERSEIYAYGIVLWEIATCKEPFEGMDAGQQTMFLAIDKKMEALPEDCPKCFADVINRSRHLDRLSRPDAGELVQLLQKCASEDL